MVTSRSRRRARARAQIALSALALAALLPLGYAAFARALAGRELFEAAVAIAYGPPAPPPAALSGSTRFDVRLTKPLGRVDPRFLSFALDTAQIVGGRFWSKSGDVEALRGRDRTAPLDLTQTRLIAAARALAPAYLRVGGTEADFVRYDVPGAPAAHSGKSESVLTAARWDALHTFVEQAGLELFFTANAGAADREHGAFTGRQTEALLRYGAQHGQHVGVWELGNEVNAFWLTLGPFSHLGAERYARDLHVFERMVHRHDPSARVAAGAVFVWPLMGEPAPRLLPELTRIAGPQLDVITWHYYPQQSRRCVVASRRARPGHVLAPQALDEVSHWARYVTGLRDQNAARAETWLGETGGAQCGGEPGDSDRFASSLWWLDQLGSAARTGQRVVVRQTLTGSHYGMLDDTTLAPRPDYVASVLWKQTMGDTVLQMDSEGDPRLRGYAHCSAHGPAGSVSVLLLNVDEHDTLTAQLPTWAQGRALLYRVEAASPSASTVRINGQAPRIDAFPLQLAAAQPSTLSAGSLQLPAASYTLAIFPDAHASACL